MRSHSVLSEIEGSLLCPSFEETGLREKLRADEERIACKGGRTAVRRISTSLVRRVEG